MSAVGHTSMNASSPLSCRSPGLTLTTDVTANSLTPPQYTPMDIHPWSCRSPGLTLTTDPNGHPNPNATLVLEVWVQKMKAPIWMTHMTLTLMGVCPWVYTEGGGLGYSQ